MFFHMYENVFDLMDTTTMNNYRIIIALYIVLAVHRDSWDLKSNNEM